MEFKSHLSHCVIEKPTTNTPITEIYITNQIYHNYRVSIVGIDCYSSTGENKSYKDFPIVFYINELELLGVGIDTFLKAVREINLEIELDYNENEHAFILYFPELDRYVNKHNKNTPKSSKTYSKDTYIYLMIDYNTNYYKIGRSISPLDRERTLQSEKPTIELLDKWEASTYAEKMLHDYFNDKRIRGEWFDLTKNDLKIIPQLIKEFHNV